MKGQHSIPSDTVCYPAKLMHGHIENLLEKGVDAIFYPCMTYNLDEGRATNCYNCPVVAYYPELLQANVAALAASRLYRCRILSWPIPSGSDSTRQQYFCGKYPSRFDRKSRCVAAAECAPIRRSADYYAQIRTEGQKAIAYADTACGLDDRGYRGPSVPCRSGDLTTASTS